MFFPDTSSGTFLQGAGRYQGEWLELQRRLAKSSFRSRFHLNEEQIRIFLEKGTDRIFAETQQILFQRLAAFSPENDGKQTPMRGYPVFIAQHACGICCRSCLHKWHHIPQNRRLDPQEIEKLAWFITAWIQAQSQKKKNIDFTPDLF